MPSLLTGLYPSVHRVAFGGNILHDEFTTLAETLHRHGYRSACFTASPHLKERAGYYQGFEVFEGSHYAENELFDPGSQIVSRATDWLRDRRGEPFLLYLHLMDVHSPRDLPQPHDGILDGGCGSVDGRQERICRYDRMIRYVDDQIAGLMTELAAMRLLERTLVIVTADHGEEHFDHGRTGHGQSLYDELIHVPLILRLPPSLGGSGQCDEIVRHIDVMPTVLEMLGIEPEAPIQGVSLMPIIRDGAKLGLLEYAETVTRSSDAAEDASWAYHAAVRTDRWKLILQTPFDEATSEAEAPHAGAEYELYDLREDPLESTNLAPIRPRVVDRLSARLAEWRESCAELRRLYESRGAEPVEEPELDEETRERLKALGYLQ